MIRFTQRFVEGKVVKNVDISTIMKSVHCKCERSFYVGYGITDEDIYLFHQGTHFRSQQFLGCHPITWQGKKGYRFAVWAPNAESIRIVGDFNDWDGDGYELEKISDEGIWSGFFPIQAVNNYYKYEILTYDDERVLKADPYACQAELRPGTASVVCSHDPYMWKDQKWCKKKSETSDSQPVLIYEVHLGTWKRKKTGELYTYVELAKELVPYVKSLGFTHIELLPITEHPFDLSWGYQTTGYFAPTARYGTHNEFKFFIDACHQANIGVILDFVPGHFCKDDFGLRLFDGTPIYEYKDSRKAEKRSWGTLTFDYGKPEVQSFLISSALYWLEEYHIDGLRIDAVASMLYLNFDREDHEEKVVNSYGGEENLEAFALLRKLNSVCKAYAPHALIFAEDSSDIEGMTRSNDKGGFGFDYKWNMGWMNDVLTYMEMDPIYRKWHHHLLTFSFMYTFSEQFILPLSHDEVVHGKKSLLNKLPGDQWQKFAQFRLLYGYFLTHPGKKLIFMGAELGQYAEWKDQEQLDWHLLQYPYHQGVFDYVKAMNHFYLEHPHVYELDHSNEGFEWIDPHNIDQSIIIFRRKAKTHSEDLIIICNFTPNVTYNYKVGVPQVGTYTEIWNSDHVTFGGSNQLNKGEYVTYDESWHGLKQHIKIKIPPLAISIFKRKNIGEEIE